MATARAKALQVLPLFSGLSGKDRELLASNMDELSLPAGMTLINQGTSNHSFFVLIGGEVDITVSGEPRTTLGRGDFFGEITMGDRGWATATAVTKTPVEAYVLSHQQFGALSAVERVLARLQAAKNQRLDADRKGAE